MFEVFDVYLAPVDILADLPAPLVRHILALSLGHAGALLARNTDTLLTGNLLTLRSRIKNINSLMEHCLLLYSSFKNLKIFFFIEIGSAR